jgi:hypothetical protein
VRDGSEIIWSRGFDAPAKLSARIRRTDELGKSARGDDESCWHPQSRTRQLGETRRFAAYTRTVGETHSVETADIRLVRHRTTHWFQLAL